MLTRVLKLPRGPDYRCACGEAVGNRKSTKSCLRAEDAMEYEGTRGCDGRRSGEKTPSAREPVGCGQVAERDAVAAERDSLRAEMEAEKERFRRELEQVLAAREHAGAWGCRRKRSKTRMNSSKHAWSCPISSISRAPASEGSSPCCLE